MRGRELQSNEPPGLLYIGPTFQEKSDDYISRSVETLCNV